MKILAIETIDVSASAALLENDTVVASQTLLPGQRSAQYLAPMVRDLLASVNWKANDIQLVGVVQGPGSFTGLRVGIAFAKVFAYAAEAEIIAVNTLDLLAENLPEEVKKVSIALDAQRGQVIARNFNRNEAGFWVPEGEMKMLELDDWAELSEGSWLAGPVLAQKRKYLPENIRTVPEEFWLPSIEALGKNVFRKYQEGERTDLWNLLPIYSRPAAAEERRMETLKKG